LSPQKLDLSRIKVLCFDVDGTLRNTDDQYIARVNTLLRPVNLLFKDRNTAKLARSLVMRFEDPINTLFTLADRLGIDGVLHRFFEFANPWKRRKKGPGYYHLVADVEAALERLASHFDMAVVTVRSARGTQSFLESTGLDRFFTHVAAGQTAPRSKPFPDQIYWIAKQFGVEPQECVMIGDTTIDIRAGKAAAAQTVGVLSGFGDEAELRSRGADIILPSVAYLPDVLGVK
jgi:HAD superfamily hydrolase (TIGR01549 family)